MQKLPTIHIAVLFLWFAAWSLSSHSSLAQNNALTQPWFAKKAADVTATGQTLTRSSIDSEQWLPAVVPGTVLTTLLENDLVPDPFFGMNNELIPDIHDTGVEEYTYWFYTTFDTPSLPANGQAWLNLRGINYKAEVYLNGHKITPEPLVGMFLRHKLNITGELNRRSTNRLAILVHPPDPPGNANGGQAGDGEIARNVTMQFTAGWDWIQPVRDRNTGIWDNISVTTSGPVTVEDPYITTDVPGKRFPGKLQDPAYVNVAFEVQNHRNRAVSGQAIYTIGDYTDTLDVRLPANSRQQMVFPPLKVTDPKLWWSNGLGQAHLYETSVSFFTSDTEVSDQKNFNIGIREIDSYLDPVTGGRIFLVNGQKVFTRGGNWIASDAMLRLSAQRYEYEVRMHAEANLNTIRIWGGSITERPEFYEATDRHGILVWQDFWITGDANGRWRDPRKLESQQVRRQYPDDHDHFLASAADQIKMLRNHASLAMWIGGNEFDPPTYINEAITNRLIPDLDDRRMYLDMSTSEELSQNIYPGTIGDGPYGYQELEDFFLKRHYPLNSEMGSVGMPVYESLQQWFTPAGIDSFPEGREMGREWRYHKFIGFQGHRTNYINIFGTPQNGKQFTDQSQYAQYLQYRALMEGVGSQMWHWYTGVVLWKTQNPWSALRGQIYDHSLVQNSALYALRKAGQPVHALLSEGDRVIYAFNNTPFAMEGMVLHTGIYTINGQLVEQREHLLNIDPFTRQRVDNIFTPANAGDVYHVKLALYHHDELVSDNFYTVSLNRNRFRELRNIGEASLRASAEHTRTGTLVVHIENSSEIPALWNVLQLRDAVSGERVIPAFYDDNYISLLPGEQKSITISIPEAETWNNARLSVSLEGLNVEPVAIPVR